MRRARPRGKRLFKARLRRLARRRGYGKVFRSFRRDIVGVRNDGWEAA